MEAMHRAGYGERVQDFHALSESPRVHQPQSSPNPVLLGFF